MACVSPPLPTSPKAKNFPSCFLGNLYQGHSVSCPTFPTRPSCLSPGGLGCDSSAFCQAPFCHSLPSPCPAWQAAETGSPRAPRGSYFLSSIQGTRQATLMFPPVCLNFSDLQNVFPDHLLKTCQALFLQYFEVTVLYFKTMIFSLNQLFGPTFKAFKPHVRISMGRRPHWEKVLHLRLSGQFPILIMWSLQELCPRAP